MLTIVNRHHKVPYDIYAGRPGILGNPFPLSEGRDKCVADYEKYAWARMHTDTKFREALLACENKRVACWCWPLNCHVNAIERLIERWKVAHPC